MRSTRPSTRSTARSRRRATEDIPLLGAEGYQAAWNKRGKIARAFGVHTVRIEHLLNRYGTLTDELLDLIRARPELGEPLPGRGRLHRGRGRLRGVARGRAAPRGRARPPHPHLDRGLGPRRLGGAGRRRAHGAGARLGRGAHRSARSTSTSSGSPPSGRRRSSRTTNPPTGCGSRPRTSSSRSGA